MSDNVNTQNEIGEEELLSKEAFIERFSHLFKASELNWLIKNRNYNGFAPAVRKIGQRKIVIHVPSVLRWVNQQKG